MEVFSFHHIKYIMPLPSGVSAGKSVDNLIGFPLYVICFFSLAAFKIFSLSLILVSLINMCLSVFLLGIILFYFIFLSFVVVVVAISWAAPAAYGGSQARGRIEL